MSTRKKQIRMIIIALLLLIIVSAYRIWSLNYYPQDPFRTYILYACYVFLFLLWGISIHSRVTQKSMRILLFLEGGVMLIGLTLRFLQDTFWYRNIQLMRVSGLYIAATILPFLLLGMYASLGIGQSDQYFMDHKWLGFLIPVLAATYMIVTDEKSHFVFFMDAAEQQPNLSFHPGAGFFVLFTIGYVMMILRVFIIYSRNRNIHGKGIMNIVIPFFEPIVMTLFTLDYFLFSLGIVPWLEGKEILELYAKIYLVEVLTWEFYIFMGLVPVNMEYQNILENSTVGMQILIDSKAIASKNAVPVSQETINELEKKGFIILKDGKELHMHALSDGRFLWYKDTSLLRKTIEDLENSAEQFSQKRTLLEEEFRAKKDETVVRIKNRIYDDLTGEVSGQLQRMKEIIRNSKDAADHEPALRKLYFLGTYVKRRYNLRLIYLESGSVTSEDVKICMEDMVKTLESMHITASLRWEPTVYMIPDRVFCVLDTLEDILAYEDFKLDRIRIEIGPAETAFEVYRASDQSANGAKEGIYPKIHPEKNDSFEISSHGIPGGYRVTLTERGGRYV